MTDNRPSKTLREVVQAVVDWNTKYPSSRIYGEAAIRRIAAEMDVIFADAKEALRLADEPSAPSSNELFTMGNGNLKFTAEDGGDIVRLTIQYESEGHRWYYLDREEAYRLRELLSAFIAKPNTGYQCMVAGCPANHISKWEVCRAPVEPAERPTALELAAWRVRNEAKAALGEFSLGNHVAVHREVIGELCAALDEKRPAVPPNDVLKALKEANDLCRASFQVCKRIVEQDGEVAHGINFEALRISLERSLVMQHAVMLKHEMFGPSPTKEAG